MRVGSIGGILCACMSSAMLLTDDLALSVQLHPESRQPNEQNGALGQPRIPALAFGRSRPRTDDHCAIYL